MPPISAAASTAFAAASVDDRAAQAASAQWAAFVARFATRRAIAAEAAQPDFLDQEREWKNLPN
jgi:hypothetical protein